MTWSYIHLSGLAISATLMVYHTGHQVLLLCDVLCFSAVQQAVLWWHDLTALLPTRPHVTKGEVKGDQPARTLPMHVPQSRSGDRNPISHFYLTSWLCLRDYQCSGRERVKCWEGSTLGLANNTVGNLRGPVHTFTRFLSVLLLLPEHCFTAIVTNSRLTQ